jgi:hypothetical protein
VLAGHTAVLAGHTAVLAGQPAVLAESHHPVGEGREVLPFWVTRV